jgi:glycosyltransferase involved in cell wall biosynthesis
MISVIIRTKNEEAWIGRCLASVVVQNHPDFEIIVVDNESTDHTLDIVSKYNCKLVTIRDEDFTFGKSLNWGIRASSGDYLAILSGHCIPANDRWLLTLRAAFCQENVVGVYGRQVPLPDTTPDDKRDLWTTFGIERRVQSKDFFFHNANSMIRRGAWEETPFDEKIAGVEDREWARQVLMRGAQIVYEPTACVYHYHGIHHGRNLERSIRVARVIELINHRGGVHA